MKEFENNSLWGLGFLPKYFGFLGMALGYEIQTETQNPTFFGRECMICHKNKKKKSEIQENLN